MGFLPHLLLFTLINLLIFHGFSEVIYEDGYTVTTVFDGNKLNINPHSIASYKGSHDLFLLDSSNSVFYTLSLPLSQESLVKRFSGNKGPEYSDGDASSATFNKPRSFTVDFKGNVYVADRSNHAIRKISHSGVTTIAGGLSKSIGRADGPGRNATFSADYELSFVPEICALLILDHGSKLIRQIDLKQEDCLYSRSGGVGSATVWAAALAVSCLVGSVVGFVIRPYILRTEELKLLNSTKSWTTYLMNLGRQIQMFCFGTRNAVASPVLRYLRQLIMLFISHLSLMFSFGMKWFYSSSSSVCKENISLLDSDHSSNSYCAVSQKYADQLKGLMTSNGEHGSSNMLNDILDHQHVAERDAQSHGGYIDTLVKANMDNFVEDASRSTVVEESFLGVSTVVKRR